MRNIIIYRIECTREMEFAKISTLRKKNLVPSYLLAYQYFFATNPEIKFEHFAVTKKCIHHTSPNKYSDFIDLFTLENVQPEEYLVRIPFYAMGDREALIVLSPKENPNWDVDNVYEIRKNLPQRKSTEHHNLKIVCSIRGQL